MGKRDRRTSKRPSCILPSLLSALCQVFLVLYIIELAIFQKLKVFKISLQKNLFKSFENSFCQIFLKLILSKICVILSKFVSLPIFVCFCQYFVFICQNLSLFVNILSKSVFCLYLSIFVFMRPDLSFLCLFVKNCLGCPKSPWVLSPRVLRRRNRSMTETRFE